MNVQTTNFVGSNLTVAQASQAAVNYDQTRVKQETEPYSDVLKIVNDDFIGHLDRFDDDPKLTLGQLKADLDAQAAGDRKKAKIAKWGGLALMAAGFVGPRVGLLPAYLSTPMLLGGLFSVMWIANPAGARADEAELFGRELADWGRALTAQGVQPPAEQPPKSQAA